MGKTIDEIYQEMLSVFGEKSGYLPSASCDLAARLYAAAAQIQALYLQAQWLLDQSFPQTARADYLDRHAQLRGISRAIATCATGTLRFGIQAAIGSDLPIGAGTVCMTGTGVRFATTEDVVLRAGELYVDAPAMALEPGKEGNVAPETVTIMAAMPVGIRACTTTSRRRCPSPAWPPLSLCARPEGWGLWTCMWPLTRDCLMRSSSRKSTATFRKNGKSP